MARVHSQQNGYSIMNNGVIAKVVYRYNALIGNEANHTLFVFKAAAIPWSPAHIRETTGSFCWYVCATTPSYRKTNDSNVLHG